MATAGEKLIKYRKEEYQAKITKLEEYVSKLKDLKDQLNTKNNQLTNIWSDPQGKKYQSAVKRALEGCDTAIKDTNITLKALRDTVDTMQDLSGEVDVVVDDVTRIANSVATF